MGTIDDSTEYQLLTQSNDMIQKIDDEKGDVYRFVVDMYSKKFPELKTLIAK